MEAWLPPRVAPCHAAAESAAQARRTQLESGVLISGTKHVTVRGNKRISRRISSATRLADGMDTTKRSSTSGASQRSLAGFHNLQ